MLLCDSLRRIATFRHDAARLGLPKQALAVPAIRMQLDACARISNEAEGFTDYVLGDDVTTAATQVLLSRPASLRDCMSVLRLPWRRAWFEWREPARVEAQRLVGISHDNGQGTPNRFGFLVTSDESGRRGTVRFAWLHPERPGGPPEIPDVSHFFLEFDFDRLREPLLEPDKVISAQEQRDSDLFSKWARSPADLEALFDINRACRMTGLNDARRYAAAVSLGSRGRATPEQAFDALAADVSGEGMHFIATVIVMTARNGTETTFEDRTKLNKARAKRGESPLNDHVVVHMRLSRAERNASPRIDAAAVGSRASPRFHAVVGHPVVRASQIFWRRAHARGYSSGRPAAITRTVQVSL